MQSMSAQTNVQIVSCVDRVRRSAELADVVGRHRLFACATLASVRIVVAIGGVAVCRTSVAEQRVKQPLQTMHAAASALSVGAALVVGGQIVLAVRIVVGLAAAAVRHRV